MVPRHPLLGTLVLVLSSWALAQADLPCDPSTPLAKQSRTDMKHRKPASPGTVTTDTTVAEMLNWDTPDDIADKQTRTSEAPVDDHEDQAFVIEGALWRIAKEAN